MKSWLLGRIGRLGALAAVCVGAALASSAPAASAAECKPITGSGSSLQSLAQETLWTKEVNFLEAGLMITCSEMPTVTYTATSSGKGLNEWGAANTKGEFELKLAGNGKEELDAFVGTDVGPEGGPAGLEEGMVEAGTQIANMDKAGRNHSTEEANEVLTIPVAQSAISVDVSLPAGCEVAAGVESVAVSNQALEEAYAGDNVTFAQLFGSQVKGSCSSEPVREAREAPSGTTAGFKRYMSKLGEAMSSNPYKSCTETAPEAESQECWPDLTALTESGNPTGGKLAEKVYATAGSIGYADLADARAAGFAAETGVTTHGGYQSFIAKVWNGGLSATEGYNVSPEAENGSSNCSAASYPEPKKVGLNIDWSRAKQENSIISKTEFEKEVRVYPICTLTYDVLWHMYSWIQEVGTGKHYHESEFNTVYDYFDWLITTGEKSASKLETGHYAPVPGTVLKEDEEGFNLTAVLW